MTGKSSFEDRLSRIAARTEAELQSKQRPGARAPRPTKSIRNGRARAILLPAASVVIGLGLMAVLLTKTNDTLTEMGFDDSERCQFARGTMLSDKYRESMGLKVEPGCE
ncbi:hypothetical protein Q4577_17875 [Marinovum sp. 2_MG-2023]|uniref:hypothetical protein n=1 Tax=unclassified Marinovum TaxID=2647166 RepID=UPI0026E2F97C|nr:MULTISPECIES: hypothetical protein [unclassified Marinovum]MDO6731904.1 hypothetical protein [Marinovum sp. 2_MG-2023]MDO6781156.1 hypothetical protein [Marinovum sp. 1_MG-2023]